MDFHLKVAIILVNILENRFMLFGKKFGFDPIIGLIPGIGDFVGLILSLYLIWIAIEMKLPKTKITKMLANILFDFFVGIFPIIGDIGDFVFKANSRNLEIIKSHKPLKIITQ